MLFLYILSFISTLNGQTFTGDERSKASRPALRQLRESVVQVKSFLDALQRHIRRSRDALRQHMHDYDLDMDIFTDDPLKTTTRPTTPYSPTFQFTLSMTTTKIFPNKPDINYSTTETPSTISTPEVNLTASEQLIMEVAPEWWVTYKVTRPDPNDVTTVLERVNEEDASTPTVALFTTLPVKYVPYLEPPPDTTPHRRSYIRQKITPRRRSGSNHRQPRFYSKERMKASVKSSSYRSKENS
ncbi:uncharacterized protein LOC142985522 isoform X2 [Anticarsia gemmatalis]|uniref:uncharacterized protein LOC142985522 isoform X2 n=1 Tax=Anticarsia gemmatalis TaxID=129554 RepID=UPI003F758726